MKKTFLISLLILGFSLNVKAYDLHAKLFSERVDKKMDYQENRRSTRVRNFKTYKEFMSLRQDKARHPNLKKNIQYQNSHNHNRHIIRQRGYKKTKQGWILAYRYDRASFYDNEGFFYGYFNYHGYYFDGIFYRYDKFYTYQDRVKGRGLFSEKYYMPENANYYGFCDSRQKISKSLHVVHERGQYKKY